MSTDEAGNIEIWDPETLSFPEDDGRLQFELLSETSFYDLVNSETVALSMEFSPDWQLLAIFGRDAQIRLFHFASGRLLRTIDESIPALVARQEAASAASEPEEELDFVESQADF